MSSKSDVSNTPSEGTRSAGRMVREARKSLGLSLADVAAMTRIPKPMLQHLEADRFDEYSAPVFARGHLRNYAREVDLEPEIVLQAFDRQTGRSGGRVDETVAEADAPDRSGDQDDNSQIPWSFADLEIDEWRDVLEPTYLVVAGLVVVGLFVVFGMLSGKRATAQNANQFAEEPSETSKENWELEEETEKSRWLLEKPAGDE